MKFCVVGAGAIGGLMAARLSASGHEVYVVGFPGLNGKWQISANGGRFPVWSRNGRELYFVGLDNKLMAVPITPGPQFQPGVPQPLFDV